MLDNSEKTIPFERLTAQPVSPLAEEHMVRMRDGVRLATDVYLPAGGVVGPGPVVLIRLPYDKNGEYTFIPDIAAYMVARGYRVVTQDVRGKFRSEGESLLWINEAYDGYDTIAWIVEQAWSDGAVGMWGDSYYGFTQLAAASSGHPALRAIAPRVTGTGLGDLPARRAGSRVSEVEMGVGRLYPVTHFQGRDTYHWEMDWSARPYADAVERWFATVGERSPSYDVTMPAPAPLRRFPAGHPFDAPAVPMLMTIGWWDNCAPWSWADHALVAARPAWALNEWLLLEDIDHENNSFAQVPYGVDDNPVTSAEARAAMFPRYLDPALEFFDIFLRGQGSARDLPRVRWKVAGEAELHAAPSWPPPGAVVESLYPSPSGHLLDTAGDATTLEWIHDPEAPVPSPVENAFEFLRELPDERDLAERDDVLSFEASPASAPLLLAGPVGLRATIASSGPEMDLFARLVDVAPDGSAHLIARGQVTLYEATEPGAVEVDMGHTGYRLAVGHRLRLTLASSDFPEFVPVPGNGGHRWLEAETEVNRQSVVLGGAAGVALSLSIIR
jgi:predicted acyl esterase